MNASIQMLITCLLLCNQLLAQRDSSGVYLSATAYGNKDMVYAINCNTQKHKIKLKTFFSKPEIVVIHNDTAYSLAKKDIYGYRDCDGKTYRFVDERVYQILNPYDPIVLYRYFVYIPKDPTVEYFFSKKYDGEVRELTKDNLKHAFPDNHEFHMLIDNGFKDNLDLASYNKKNKAYKLMEVFLKTIDYVK
ncbi:MAG TPA: hypothetical protein PKJ63_00400 [Cyclobacteriaceae bacterium]|nr:hypothetical protein [Cyclobacteriaceae bacterium]